MVRDQLIEHIEKNNLLSKNQHGFRRGFSCLTKLLAHYEEILRNYMNGSDTDVIYLDYAKAFDKVDHILLLKKLKMYRITGHTYKWIEAFLQTRTQKVVIKGYSSFIAAVLSGVPQGSVLGPILFLIFINDINYIELNSTIRCFADDTRLTKSIQNSQQDTTKLQSDLDAVTQWSEDNNMTLNKTKFEIIFHESHRNFNTKLLLSNLPFSDESSASKYQTINGYKLLPQSRVCDLGSINHQQSNMVSTHPQNC